MANIIENMPCLKTHDLYLIKFIFTFFDLILWKENYYSLQFGLLEMNHNKSVRSKSPVGKNQSSVGISAYNFLRDPHLIYYLQSPVRVTQLLQSGMYQLDGQNLIELQSLESLKIAQYVLQKIPNEIKEQHSFSNSKLFPKIENKSNLYQQNQSLKWDASTSVLLQNKNSYNVPKNNWKNIYSHPIRPKPKANKKFPDENMIKGLKNFQKKIL